MCCAGMEEIFFFEKKQESQVNQRAKKDLEKLKPINIHVYWNQTDASIHGKRARTKDVPESGEQPQQSVNVNAKTMWHDE